MRGTKPWEIRNERARLAWLARGRQSRFGISRSAYRLWTEGLRAPQAQSEPLTLARIAFALADFKHEPYYSTPMIMGPSGAVPLRLLVPE